MSQDGENDVSEDIMVPEISSSTHAISEQRTHHSRDDVMVATVDSSVPSPMSQEVDDEDYNSDDQIVGARDSNDASPPISQEVSDECSNASDLIVGTTGNNEESSSMSQEVDDESSNTGEFMIETPDSDDTSSMSQEFVDECPNGGAKEDSNDASPIFQEVAECSNTENIGTVEDQSIAGEFSELVLSVSIAKSEDLPSSEDCSISSPITSPTQMDTSSLSVDQTKQTDDNRKELSLSPSKRRHFSSKQEPESKKPNTSKESDEDLSACNYDVKLEETIVLRSPEDSFECAAEVVPQSMKDPVLCDLEPKTDTHEGSTVSNDSNKTPICEVPPISGQKNPIKEIRKENPKLSAFFNNVRLTWETLMEETSDQAINLSSMDIPSGSKDTSQRPFQYKEDIDGKSQFEIVSVGHQPPQESMSSEVSKHAKQSDLIRDTTLNSFPILLPVEIQPLTRDDFIPELESLVDEYAKGMQAEALSEPIVEEHLRTFQIQYIETINGFQGAMEQTLARIQNLDLSPDINVSSLLTVSSDLLKAAVRVEKVWREFKVLLTENSDFINVINMTQHRTRCLQYFDKFMLAILRHIYTLPEEHLRESES